jgi:hypothetical protein
MQEPQVILFFTAMKTMGYFIDRIIHGKRDYIAILFPDEAEKG